MTMTVSAVSTGLASALFGVLAFGGLNNLVEPEGIVPHSLEYNGAGAITQARTVYSEEPFAAVFKANIHTTQQPDFLICSGGGGWPYRPGFVEVNIDIDEWVGEAGCEAKLPNDTWLVACAEWQWGEESVSLCTPRFKL